MKNFLMKTFQGKIEAKPQSNISKDSKTKKLDTQKSIQNNKINLKTKNENNKNTNKIIQRTKISQEIMNSNLSLIGHHPITQNLTEENKSNNTKKDEIKKEPIKKNNYITYNTDINKNLNNGTNDNNNNKSNNTNNKKYKEPFKPIGQYIIDKTLRFEENKSKKKIKNNNNNNEIKNDNNNINNDEFNSDEEDELIKSKRKKMNKALNLSKKKKTPLNKIRPGKSLVKKVINSLINDNEEDKNDDSNKNINLKERKTISEIKPKTQSGNFVRLNLKKKYKEKKRLRPVNIRKITLNHSKELYKYQKKTIKNTTNNNPYMGQGNSGLEDIDTLMKEQNDADKNDNNNLINTLVEKLPVFSQSFIEETQKTPLKPNSNNNIDNNNNEKENIIEKVDKTPMTNRLTTILKNSLQKKVSLDTELKFLSQEFRYLLSGQKEKIIKLNEIKKETLLTKQSLEIIDEEKNIKVNNTNDRNENENENINNYEKIDIEENEMSKEEIEKMENEILLTVLKENFNYENFHSDLQLNTIKNILNKNNIFYISSPGKNQNLCYEFPSLLFEGITVVISPLLPNITQNLTSLPNCLKAAAITSFTTASQKKEIYEAIKSKILNILYITPERFVLEKLDELKSFNISLICIEDAIYGTPNSSNFRPFYINLISKIKTLINNGNNDMNEKEISLLLLSNYITNIDKKNICELFDIIDFIEEPLLIEPEINICISKENNIKLSSLLKLLRTIPTNKNIFSVIFCNYKKTINEVTTYLNQNGISATSYHGGKDEIERQIIQSNFIKNKIKILVCTSNYSLCFIQNFIKYIIIYEMPFSIEQLLNEVNKNDNNKTQKYVHIFLDDNHYLNQRKLIFADMLERKSILTFIDFIFKDKSNSSLNNNKFKKKRNYLQSIGELTDNNNNEINNTDNNSNNNYVNKVKCVNLNNIEEVYNIKRNYALFFLISLSKYKPKNNENEDDLSNILDVLGIGPSEITIRFFKTSPNVLSEKEPLLKTILSNCKERLGGYTFNVSNICNISSINYNEILLYLFKLQEQKEISYETKEDGIFIKIKKKLENNMNKNLLTFFYDLNNNLIHEKIQKLNCVYILLRKYSVNNSSIFHNMENTKLTQIKCLEFCGNYDSYKEEINKKIYSYFDLYNNQCINELNKIDDLYAGNATEKDILLPVVKLENQRDKINFIKNLKELIKKFLQYEINISVIDVLYVLFGYFQKGKGIKNYMSHPMWNKYSNYDFEQLFEIVDTELRNIKIELINEDNKQIGSKKLKTN